MIPNNVTKQSRWTLSQRYLEKMNSVLHPGLRELFLPTPIANTPNHFFFKPKNNYQVFRALVNTYGKGPSAVFGVSWQSYKPRTWHYSGQLKKKGGKQRSFVIFSKGTDKLPMICQQQQEARGKMSLVYAPVLERWIFVNVGKEKKCLFALWQSGKLSSVRDDSGMACGELI